MRRLLATVASVLLPAAASAQTMQDALAAMERSNLVQGIAGIIRAEEDCGFALRREALNDYLREQGMLDPKGLAEIDNQVYLARELSDPELSPTQCAMRKAAAEQLGLLSEAN
ncbi:hypothetical protein [Aurantimonas coralicida]|uniref:hypothetical protein n=1 Tax=Aurantimonas coralicida TaxID=182270 RepID=UPI001E5E7997|nr:hypothetical protein [Aurantimonas coralicida]MCD1645246.1 hypothetical protein [Aurantimonas coralicida]